MKKIILTLVAVIAIAGCTTDNHDSMMTNPGVAAFAISPADGENGVRLDAGITLTFAKGVDRAVTEAGFRLVSEADMADSACPVNLSMGHGDMGTAMGDSSRMAHLDDVHSTRGHFAWNGDLTQCTFKPDSMLVPGMRYMVHLGPEMTRMMADRMGEMGMMAGHGSGMMAGQMMMHFLTLDTAAVGSGHDGHH